MGKKDVIYVAVSVLLTLAVFVATSAGDQTYYVDADNGNDANSGTAPGSGNAWKTITHAVKETTEDGTEGNPVVIRVAAATNKYDTANGEEFAIVADAHMTIVGGGAENTIVSADLTNSPFVFLNNSGGAKLEGLTLESGIGACGGGIYCYNSSPEIKDCVIRNSVAYGSSSSKDGGGGVYCDNNSNPTFINCTITGNSAHHGGGLYCLGNSNATLSNCTIIDNEANSGGGVYCSSSSPSLDGCQIGDKVGEVNRGNRADDYGGGICCDIGSSPRLENCRVEYNEEPEYGGGLACMNGSSPTLIRTVVSNNRSTAGDGSGIYIARSSSPVIVNCEVENNVGAQYGAGIYMAGAGCDPTIKGTTIRLNTTGGSGNKNGGGICCLQNSSPAIEDCLIEGNKATYGGGIWVRTSCTPKIGGCTIIDNEAFRSGGGVWCGGNGGAIGPEMRIEHCVISGNQSSDEESWGGAGIYCEYSASPTIFNCLITGNWHVVDHTYDEEAAGITCKDSSAPTVINCTLEGNDSGGVSLNGGGAGPTLTNCILWNNGDEVIGIDCSRISHCDIQDDDCNDDEDKNLQADPVFASGPDGDYYLSEMEAGQDEDSPCIDQGDRNASEDGLDVYTTRTDEEYDTGVVDIGYHYRGDKGTYYVDANSGADSNNGSSAHPWKTITKAFTETQDEGSSTNPITIIVAGGDYNTGNGETFPLEPKSNYLTLIGAGCDITKIDASGSNKSAMQISGKEHVTVEGFTITGGNASAFLGSGGAVKCVGSDNILIDVCNITGNHASAFGGALYFSQCGADTVLRGSTISRGSTDEAGYGGGVYCFDGSQIKIAFCQLTDNSATFGGGVALDTNCAGFVNASSLSNNTAGYGGGICIVHNSSPTIFNSSVMYNEATDGGGIYCKTSCKPAFTYAVVLGNSASRYGGGLYAESSTPKLGGWDEILANDAGSAGGGIYCTGCTWDHAAGENFLLCAIVAENTASDTGVVGGGIHLAGNSDPWIINCTVEGNSPTGVASEVFSEPRIIYSIIWNNGDDLCGVDCSYVRYCDIEDEGDCNGSDGIMHDDPLFVPRDGTGEYYTGYYLAHQDVQRGQSPCIDAGDPNEDASEYGMHAFTTCTDGRNDWGEQGSDDRIVDLGYHYRGAYEGSDNTYIELASFEAKASGRSILITWETGTEIDNAGFDLYRAEAGDRTTPRRINERMIPAKGSPAAGAAYEFIDADVRPGITYSYYLIDIDTSGAATAHGPVTVRVSLSDWDPRPQDATHPVGVGAVLVPPERQRGAASSTSTWGIQAAS